MDLRELEGIVRSVASDLDRSLIVSRDFDIDNQMRSMFKKIVVCEKGNPTLENIALMIAERIYRLIGREDITVGVTLYEGARYFCSVSYP